MPDRIELRRSLSEGLGAWLNFEAQCEREGLFSERYLAMPLAQLLAAKTGGQVEAEQNHPVLSVPGKLGRPPQIDFLVKEAGVLTLAIESKWVGESGISVVDVVWDCTRLELAAHHWGCDALFVLAGRRDRVGAALTSKPFRPKGASGRPALVLGLHGEGRASVNIQSPKRDFGKGLHKILAGYRHVDFPRSLVCGTGTQVPKDAPSAKYTAIVWSIRPEAAAKRFTFRAT